MTSGRKILRCLLLVPLLGALAGGVYMYFYVNELAQPVLTPVNQSYAGYSHVPRKAMGLRLEPFTFVGWDGGRIQAVVASKEGEESSRQLSVIGNLAVEPAPGLSRIDYVLVSVDWDHGIRSALPLAESLTAAGLTCVLWDPRGEGDRRPYCTHGLKESEDVPCLIDALVARSNRPNPVIVGVGQGFGAGMLLQAAARDERLSGLVSVDACASLRRSVQRTMEDAPFKFLTFLLMDLKINSSVGFECFDVAPVESAAKLRRHVPVLVVNLAQDNPVSTLMDALTIYRQLPSDWRSVWTLRSAADAPEATVRELDFRSGSDDNRRVEKVCVNLMKDEDSVIIGMIHWLDDCVARALDAPRVVEPPRPELTVQSQP